MIVVVPEEPLVLVDVHVALGRVEDAARDVGAVVRDALDVGQEIRPDEAGHDRTGAFLQAQDMSGAQLLRYGVDDLLERLRLLGGLVVVLAEGLVGKVQDLREGGAHAQVFSGGLFGEDDVLLVQLFRRLQDVDGVVADALVFPDYHHVFGGSHAFLVAELPGGQFHQVRSQDILQVVRFILSLPHPVGLGEIVVQDALQAFLEREEGPFAHVLQDLFALVQGQGRADEQALVEFLGLLRYIGIRDDEADQFLKQSAEGQEKQRAEQVEDRVGDRYPQQTGRLRKNFRGVKRLHYTEDGEPHGGADDVEAQVDEGGAPGVLVRPQRGDESRGAGADVLPHDDRYGRPVGHGARNGQRLQDTDGSRAGLDYSRQDGARQNAQQGIRKEQEELLEGRHVPQDRDGPRHRFHAVHQRGEAQEYHAGVLALALLGDHI